MKCFAVLFVLLMAVAFSSAAVFRNYGGSTRFQNKRKAKEYRITDTSDQATLDNYNKFWLTVDEWKKNPW